MKRLISLIGIILLCLVSWAVNAKDSAPESIPVEIKTDQVSSPGKHRAPGKVHIEVLYYSDQNLLEVINSGELEGEVFLLHDGTCVGYSNTIECEFQLPLLEGVYSLFIDGHSWQGVATFDLQDNNPL